MYLRLRIRRRAGGIGVECGILYSHNKMRLGHGNGSWLTGVVRLMVHMHAVSKTTMLEEMIILEAFQCP